MRLFNSARQYHHMTRYSFDDVKAIYRELPPDSQTQPVKQYPDKKTIVLPKNFTEEVHSLSKSLEKSADFSKFFSLQEEPVSLAKLSQLLYQTNGVTLVKEFSTKKQYFRASPSAGMLYPVEIYIFVKNVEELQKGLYYYHPHEHLLVLLNTDINENDLAEGSFQLNLVSQAPVVFFFTSILFRNRWKYQERTFRYAMMDAGYIFENLVISAASLDLTANLIGDFVDQKLNDLLNIDAAQETCLMLASVGFPASPLKGENYQFGMNQPENDQIKDRFNTPTEGIYQNSSHHPASDDLVNVEVNLPFLREIPSKEIQNTLIPLSPHDKNITVSTYKVIQERRSTHNFLRVPIKFEELSTLLYYLGKVPVLYNFQAYSTYMVVSDVENLDNGIYLYHQSQNQLELLKKGTLRGDISYLTLAQDAVFNCSVSFFLSTDFEQIDIFSNRGYRYAHMNVGMLSECIYLVATALGLGARGIGNFFDENINSFFRVREGHEYILGGVIVGKS